MVFGKGQIAEFLPHYFSDVVLAEADITKPEEVEREIFKHQPRVVINTAAKTSIDWCEQNKEEAFKVNTLGAYNIGEICLRYKIFLVHFSSGCIYHSTTYDQIYKESDKPNPRCYYSWTKVWADNLLGKDPNLLILRPRVVISSEISPRNTLAKLMVYSHFIKDQNSVTIVEDLMNVLPKMVEKRLSGTFNIVNKGTISPLEIARLLQKRINPAMDIQETTLDEVNKNLVAKRCSTVLDTTALTTVGFELPHVDDAVPKVVEMFARRIEVAGGLGILDNVRQETAKKYTILQDKPTTYVGKN